MDLSAAEVRVLGCLLEKQLTTPDVYPLTLNSLRLACNQSTNRDPVVDYDEDVLREALRRLERRGYIRLASGHSSRASKYRHLLAEALPLSEDEHAVMCVLMLRGPQTPGELKQRGERMHSYAGLEEVHETLERLIARELARRLERRPGQKEERYEHSLSADLGEADEIGARAASELVAAPGSSTIPRSDIPSSAGTMRHDREPAAVALAALEERVAKLEHEVTALRAQVEESGMAEAGGSSAPIEAEATMRSEPVVSSAEEPTKQEPAPTVPEPESASAFQP
jgi:uncharacterized protein